MADDDPLLVDLKSKLGIDETDPAPGADPDDPLLAQLKMKADLRAMLVAPMRPPGPAQRPGKPRNRPGRSVDPWKPAGALDP